MFGYLSEQYALSLPECGTPHPLTSCGGYLLVRNIPQTSHSDVVGSYPLFCCQNWDKLGDELQALRGQMVSVALVTDPFGEYQVGQLREYFPDRMIHYKDHFVVDFTAESSISLPDNHKRNVQKGLRNVTVELCTSLESYLEDWVMLYQNLIARHGIRGVAAFSRRSFVELFKVPGLLVFRAMQGTEVVGMILFINQGDVSYYHLAAYTERGYDLRASYALFHVAIEHLKSLGIKRLGLGAGAGVQAKEQDGLTRFKQGWSNASKPVYFCGCILDHDRYQEIVQTKSIGETLYFPAYRLGEF